MTVDAYDSASPSPYTSGLHAQRTESMNRSVGTSRFGWAALVVASLLIQPAFAQISNPDIRELARTLRSQATGTGAGSGSASTSAESLESSTEAKRLSPSHKPLTPNAFQQHVFEMTGERLPLFGQTLFETAPPTTGAVGTAASVGNPYPAQQLGPVSPDYVLSPGDEVLVKVYSPSVDLDEKLIVNREGALLLPKIGPVNVAGLRVADLERRIRAALSKSLTDFNLYVSLGRLRGMEVYVTGMARTPGKYSLHGMSTAISAIFATGGPSSAGSFRGIEVIRGGNKVATIDLYQFFLKGDLSQDVALRHGDVLHIPRSGPQVALMGAVKDAAVFELKANQSASLEDLLTMAGGAPVLANPNEIIIERADPQRMRPISLLQVAADEAGRKTRLQDGDLVRLKPISLAPENLVTLRILGEAPVRMPIAPGTRVSDLIPGPEALLTRGYFLRQLEHHKANGPELGLAANVSPTQTGNTSPTSPTAQAALQAQQRLAAQRSLLAQQASLSGLPAPLGAASQPTPNTEPTKPSEDQSKDREYKRLREATEAAEINWERALIERMDPLTLQPNILGFNLEAAVVDRDPAHNLELRAGDVITVMLRKEVEGPATRKTRLVRLQGEVNRPGVYQIGTQETLASLVARAGGTTQEAYLFGTRLTRRSVQLAQQKNIEDVARQLEAKLKIESVGAISGASSDSTMLQQQISARNQILAQQQVDRLRAMRPEGRVALEMNPNDKLLPEILLEDADEIFVPTMPSSIFVAGAVLNENALRFRPGRSLYEVIRQAGATPTADTNQAFVLRADGSAWLPELVKDDSLWSANTLLGWARKEQTQEQIALMPGDTVIVPERLIRESAYSAFARGLKDWTQIIYQLGLGAAAVRTLN